MDDNGIIALYNERDEQAIAETDKKYGNYCLTIAFNVLSVREDSEECVNDAYLKLWNTIPPTVPQCLKSFVGRITRNLAIDRYRASTRKKRGETVIALHELEDCIKSDTGIGSELDMNTLSDSINRFLRSLPEKECNIFLCRYYFVYSIKDISKRHGIKESHLRVILSRTRKKLREYLEKEGITI